MFWLALGLAPAGAAGLTAVAATSSATAAESGASSQEAVQRLLEVLQDETARNALIEKLKAESTTTAATATATTAAPAADEPPNLAEDLARTTVDAAGSTVDVLQRAGTEILRLGHLGTALAGPEAKVSPLELAALLATVIVTCAIHALLSRARGLLNGRVKPRAGATLWRRSQGVAVLFVLRIATVALAWFAGQLLVRFVLVPGGSGSALPVAQALYLNAFAVFGGIRSVIAVLACPDADEEPALSALAPGAQTIIYRNLRAIAGTVTQGYLCVVPVVQLWGDYVAARSIRTCIATLAAVLALVAIRQVSHALALAKGDRTVGGNDAAGAMAEGAHSAWARTWPTLAVIYVLYCWFVAVSRPLMVDQIVLGGSVHTLVAIVLLLMAMRLLRSAARLRAPMPAPLLVALPRLKPRADIMACAAGWICAIIMVVVAFGLVFQGWGWFGFWDWLGQGETQRVLWRLASAALILFGAGMLWAMVASWIDHRLRDAGGAKVSARSRTLLSLFRNAFTVALTILSAMIALSQIGIDIAPLLAGAGVIGLAIGFGAQKMVQDIITGVFIQLENAINEGDVVTVAGITGGVEKLTIRSVTLRSGDGAAHIVPFSSVSTVTNLTRDFSYHVAQIGAAYKESTEAVKAAMLEAFDRLRSDELLGADIIGELEMHGVTSLGENSVVTQARIKTRPGKQWGVGRRYTELVKQVMDERGLEIPYPHRQIVLPGGVSLTGTPASVGATA